MIWLRRSIYTLTMLIGVHVHHLLWIVSLLGALMHHHRGPSAWTRIPAVRLLRSALLGIHMARVW